MIKIESPDTNLETIDTILDLKNDELYAYDGNSLELLTQTNKIKCYKNETYAYTDNKLVITNNINDPTETINMLNSIDAYSIKNTNNIETKRMIYNGSPLKASNNTYSIMFTKRYSTDIGLTNFESNLKLF